MQLKILVLGMVGAILLAACGERKSDSASFTPPPGYDSTIGTCNPDRVYPPGTVCNPPVPVDGKGFHLVISSSSQNCPITFGFTNGSGTISAYGTTTGIDKTFPATPGSTFAASASSTCGAGGSASIKLYKDGTLVASDSAVGPNIARVSASY